MEEHGDHTAHSHRRPRSHHVRNSLIGLAAIIAGGVVLVSVVLTVRHVAEVRTTDRLQSALQPFYVAPAGWQQQPVGTILRRQPVSGVPAEGTGWRILYRTQRSNGSPAVSGGLVFLPGAGAPPVPSGGRPVVAWAHPTSGMGASCAPSRTPDVESDVQGLSYFLRAGWVVTATDYAGLGTEGIQEYLVGTAEAHDVLNSVRAARMLPGSGAGNSVLLWGHSQGGASALWAADTASAYAPELHVVAAAAAAPAAELPVLLAHQWNSLVGSLIGSEVLVAWPVTYQGLSVSAVSTASATHIRTLAFRCVAQAAIALKIKSLFGGTDLFDRNPLDVQAWRAVAEANSPAPPTVPTLVVQETTDGVVLAGSTAAWLATACISGAEVTGDYIGGTGDPSGSSGIKDHATTGIAAAPYVFTWFQQRIAGDAAGSSCGTRSPVAALAA
jgi:hypothetical protein